MNKKNWIEVTHVAVTCWVFAAFGDIITIVSVAAFRPDFATLALLASVLLAFLGFHNVREHYTYWAPRFIKYRHHYYYDGEYQAVGQSEWYLWMFLGIVHMMAMGGIVSCGILIASVIGKLGG